MWVRITVKCWEIVCGAFPPDLDISNGRRVVVRRLWATLLKSASQHPSRGKPYEWLT